MRALLLKGAHFLWSRRWKSMFHQTISEVAVLVVGSSASKVSCSASLKLQFSWREQSDWSQRRTLIERSQNNSVMNGWLLIWNSGDQKAVQWHSKFLKKKKEKKRKSQWIYQYSAKLSFRNKDEIKTCLDEWKPRYFAGSLFFQDY